MVQASVVAIDVVFFVLAVYLLRRLVQVRSPRPVGLPIVHNLFD
jgi:hypothetical protein